MANILSRKQKLESAGKVRLPYDSSVDAYYGDILDISQFSLGLEILFVVRVL